MKKLIVLSLLIPSIFSNIDELNQTISIERATFPNANVHNGDQITINKSPRPSTLQEIIAIGALSGVQQAAGSIIASEIVSIYQLLRASVLSKFQEEDYAGLSNEQRVEIKEKIFEVMAHINELPIEQREALSSRLLDELDKIDSSAAKGRDLGALTLVGLGITGALAIQALFSNRSQG